MKLKTVLKKIKSFLLGLIAVIFFVFALCMTILLLNFNDYGVTEFGDTSIILMKDSIASENYVKGDLVLVDKQRLENIAVGDEVFTYSVDSKGVASVDLGIVGQTYIDENAISYENGSTYSMENVIGKASKVYPEIGTYLAIIESQWGFLFIVLVPCFLIFIYEVYLLIIEIKYGEEVES